MDQQLDRVPLGRTGLTVTRLGLGTAPLASIFWGNDEAAAWRPPARASNAASACSTRRRSTGSGNPRPDSAGRWRRSIATTWWSRPRSGGRSSRAGYRRRHRRRVRLQPRRDVAISWNRAWSGSVSTGSTSSTSTIPRSTSTEAIDGTYAALDQLRARRRRAGRVARHELRRDGALLPDQRRFGLCDGGRSPDAPRPVGGGPRPRVPTRRRRVSRRGRVQQRRARRSAAGRLVRLRAGVDEVLERAAAIRAVCESHGVPLRTAALQYPLTVDGVTAVIVGMSSPPRSTTTSPHCSRPSHRAVDRPRRPGGQRSVRWRSA